MGVASGITGCGPDGVPGCADAITGCADGITGCADAVTGCADGITGCADAVTNGCDPDCSIFILYKLSYILPYI